MNVPKPTSTALARILALPIAAGLLAGCDYASKLPDAPTTLGYELQSKKPPSVTGIEAGEAPRVVTSQPSVQGPPLPPVQRTAQAPLGAPNLDTKTLKVNNTFADTTRTALVVPPALDLPAPQAESNAAQQVFGPPPPPAPETGLARMTTVGTPATDFPVAEYQVPQIGVAVESDAQFESYEPVPFDATEQLGGQFVAMEPVGTQAFETQAFDAQGFEAPSYETQPYEQSFDVAALSPAPEEIYSSTPSFEAQDSQVLYSAPPLAAPLPYEAIDTTQNQGISILPSPAQSPIMVLHSRLNNGAIVNVHPVVGAPSITSTLLARTISSELGAAVDESATRSAPAVFDLRASASRDGDKAEAEWKLFSANGALVGVFGESQNSGTWTTMGDDALRAMGRRVADRLRRNADLRRATITSVASAPSIVNTAYAGNLPSGAPRLAPMPRRRPARGTTAGFAQAQTTPYTVTTQQLAPLPRQRPEGVRTAALAPLDPITYTPTAPSVTAPAAPIIDVQPTPAPKAFAPLGRPLPAAPLVSAPPAAVPQPSFDTLRAAVPEADGPRALVFRGVRGAPGDGDQALSREVSRLLAQSGAQLAPNGTPNALYLTADVSRSRGPGSDKIKITWFVEDASGKRVGQVVQENEVPTGQLDSNWGQDAFYAAQGARDGIMELLRTSGALDA